MIGRRPWLRIWRPSSTHAVRAVKVRSALIPVSLSSMATRMRRIGSMHLDLERADAQVGGLERRATRRVERVLLAVAHDAEAAVEDAQVRVQRGADAEVELAVVLVAVEPVAVVGVAIAAHGRGDRLRRLVDRVVVELAQHCGPPPGSPRLAGSVTPARSARRSRRTPRNPEVGATCSTDDGPRDRDRRRRLLRPDDRSPRSRPRSRSWCRCTTRSATSRRRSAPSTPTSPTTSRCRGRSPSSTTPAPIARGRSRANSPPRSTASRCLHLDEKGRGRALRTAWTASTRVSSRTWTSTSRPTSTRSSRSSRRC